MFLTTEDLAPFADIEPVKARAMIEGVEAFALTAVPALAQVTDQHVKVAIRTVLMGAVLRWHEAGTGLLTQRSQTAGVFSQSETHDTRQTRRAILWPSEIQQLRGFVEAKGSRQAGSFDTAPGTRYGGHQDWCNLVFGAGYCSCGANLIRHEEPLYEGGRLTPDPGPEYLKGV